MTVDLNQVRAFERMLDAELVSRPIFSFNANESLALAANISEGVASESHDLHLLERFGRGLSVLAPRLVSGAQGAEPDPERVVEDITFAAHYYILRDHLYYTYNAPDAMSWTFSEDTTVVRFNDPSIPRHFFTVHNDWFLNSMDAFQDLNNEDVKSLLKDQPEGTVTDNVHQALLLIEREANLKLTNYFAIVDPDSTADLGGYSYQQFITVYRSLLVSALYRRYFADVNGALGAIFMNPDHLMEEIKEGLDIPGDTAALILKDVIFSRQSLTTRTDAAYFSLLQEGAPPYRIVMRPNHFAIAEGLVNLLRIVAHRRPETFLRNVSNEIGRGFVRRAKAAFEAQGFTCRSEVSLTDFDTSLPDIDLLVVSEEPTLGYVLLVCELKSPIPSRWAKDELKALRPDGVSKAFRQAQAIGEFLKTDRGAQFIRNVLPEKGLPNFDGFVVLIRQVIITSENSGMFFSGESTPVISFRTLERLLSRSDGDMAFILHVLATYNEHADECFETVMIPVNMGGHSVSYEAVALKSLLDFPALKWRDSPERQQMIDDFIASGAHPFDVFTQEDEAHY